MRFLQLGLLALSAAASVGSASAGLIALDPAPCQNGSLQSYLNLVSGVGCTVGDFKYKDFSFSVRFLDAQGNPVEGPVNEGTKVATPDSILITSPQTLVDSISFSSPDFLVLGGDRVVYDFGYSIDPPPPIMPGYRMTMDTLTPVFPGNAQANAFVCPDSTSLTAQVDSEGPNKGLTTGATCQADVSALILHVFHTGLPSGNQLLDSGFFPTPTNRIAVLLELELNASQQDQNGAFGSSQIAGLDSGVVPEPGSLALMGAGLAALALLRRRR
jgi:hypothetical protein